MRTAFWFVLACAFVCSANAAEVTVKNDSLTDFGNASIVWGFVPGEMAASWLTSPCDGNLVAVQLLWLSPAGISGQTIEQGIHIYRGGSFPTPGPLAEDLVWPLLTDGALNEWRYLDDDSTVSLSVPVEADETFVIAFEFMNEPTAGVDPSVVRDTDGITPGGNAIYAKLGASFSWFDSAALGVTGDWVIRGVVNCQAANPDRADVAVTMTADKAAYTAGEALQYTITIDNAGPDDAPGVTIIDAFPTAYESPSWSCQASTGATCLPNGSGDISGSISLPAGSDVTIVVDGTVAQSTTGTLSNTVDVMVDAPVVDPNPGNNSSTVQLEAAFDDVIFADGFEGVTKPGLVPVPARLVAHPGN